MNDYMDSVHQSSNVTFHSPPSPSLLSPRQLGQRRRREWERLQCTPSLPFSSSLSPQQIMQRRRRERERLHVLNSSSPSLTKPFPRSPSPTPMLDSPTAVGPSSPATSFFPLQETNGRQQPFTAHNPHNQHIHHHRTPSPPTTRHSPSSRIPFDCLSRTPLPPSLPHNRSPSSKHLSPPHNRSPSSALPSCDWAHCRPARRRISLHYTSLSHFAPSQQPSPSTFHVSSYPSRFLHCPLPKIVLFLTPPHPVIPFTLSMTH
jgi:hypothetical protein